MKANIINLTIFVGGIATYAVAILFAFNPWIFFPVVVGFLALCTLKSHLNP